MTFIKEYFRDLILVLTEPKRFFRERHRQMSFSQALTFGVVSNWIAAVLMSATRLIKHESLLDAVKKIRNQMDTLPIWKDIPDSIWEQSGGASKSFLSANTMELGGIALSPFQSLFHFSLSGIFLLFGAYMLVPRTPDPSGQRDPVALAEFMRLTAIVAASSLVSAILGFLPLGLGPVLGWIYSIALLAIGLSTRYQISTARALGMMLLPWLIALFLCGCVVSVFFGFFAAIFGGLFAGH